MQRTASQQLSLMGSVKPSATATSALSEAAVVNSLGRGGSRRCAATCKTTSLTFSDTIAPKLHEIHLENSTANHWDVHATYENKAEFSQDRRVSGR